MIFDNLSTFLFVPANRPERFAKAAGAGADAIIVDLEDAVAQQDKAAARSGLAEPIAQLGTDIAIFIRINGAGTAWHADDLAVVAALPVTGVLLPKAESAHEIAAVRQQLPSTMKVIAIIETARGLASVDEVAAAADRLAFGSVDLAVDLGCAHERDCLLFARSRVILAARLVDGPAPIDGVSLSIKDEAAIQADARYGVRLGFRGKLLIHPAQISPTLRGLAPTDEDFHWAERIVSSAADGTARAIDGMMIDAPVLERARQIVHLRNRYLGGETA